MDGRGQHGGAIAIVGIACQFPGAKDPAEFHALTVAGRRMFRPIPGPAGTTPNGQLYGALLDDWAAPHQPGEGPGQRDPGPLHKLTAETAALALADARIREASIREVRPGARENTALIIASTIPDVCQVARNGFGIGPAGDFPPAAYQDSLCAVAMACGALDAGVVDLAVAGGAELGVADDWLARRAAAGDLGTTQMRVYDAEPTGLLPGDGCGIVVLMRSADAHAAGLPVYAEIVGWAARQASPEAYDLAMVSPADVQLIEGHGAGTATGDLAELSALARLRDDGIVPSVTDASGPGAASAGTAALGAASACIGYTAGAAGAASLIKAVVAMVAGTIPPATGWVQPHRLIESGRARLRLPSAPEPWPDGTRLAAVNSLGPAEGATDGAHLVLRRETEDGGYGRRRRGSHAGAGTRTDRSQADRHVPPAGARPAAPGKHSAHTVPAAHAEHTAPIPAAAPAKVTVPDIPAARTGDDPRPVPAPPAVSPPAASPPRFSAGEAGEPPLLFTMCGAEPAVIAATLDVISASAAELAIADLRELARNLAAAAQQAAERGAALRAAVTAATPGQLAERARYAAGQLRAGVRSSTMLESGISISSHASGRIVVVFPGLASTAAGHAAQLTASLGALGILDRLGVTAASAVGYGLGEIAGLVWAGCLPPAEAARLAGLYGRVLQGCTSPAAATARVAAGTALARQLCAQDGLAIAAYEAADSHLVTGSGDDIRSLIRRCAAAHVCVEVVAGTGGLHSPAVARCAAPLRTVLAATPFAPPRRQLVSTVTGQPVAADEDIAALLTSQLTQPVLFAQAMTLAAAAADLIVVTGPQPGLTAIAAAAGGRPAITLPPASGSAGNAGQGAGGLAGVVAALFTAGATDDLAPFLLAREQDPDHVTWSVPPMRDGSQEGGQSTDTGTTGRSEKWFQKSSGR
jgi:enediyne polyketide synthase